MDDCGTGDYSAPSADYSSAPDTSADYSSAPDTSTYCSSAPDTSTHCSSAPDTSTHCSSAPDAATHCSSAPDTSKHCSSGPDTSKHCSNVPDMSTHCSNSVDPPPDYSTFGSHPETGRSNHHLGTTDTTQHSHHWHPISGDGASESPVTGHLLHDIVSSAPFFDVTSESNPYNSQSSYNPSYMAARSTTPSPTIYGRKTILLKRTDAQNSPQNIKLTIGVFVGLMIGAIIPLFVFLSMAR